MLAAIEARWPEAELHQCEWHLQHALDRLLAKEARNDPSGELHELREYAESALVGPSSWHRFVRAAKAGENEGVDRWIAVNAATIETQFARRALTPHGALDMPLTTAALDQITRPIVAALYPRSLRAQEPRAPEPPADALTAPRQRPRRCSGVCPRYPPPP
jgi:hypothetical protein